MKNKVIVPTEHQIQTQIMNYLQMKGYYVMRLNTGMIENKYGGRIRLSPAGTPDIMAFKNGNCDVGSKLHFECKDVELLFIEVKRPQNSPTRLQEMKMEELVSFGAKCLVAHSLDEVIEGLK